MPEYYGVERCSAVIKSRNQPCRNKAYYRTADGCIVCGTHGRGRNPEPLPVDPNKVRTEREVRKQELREVEAAAARAEGKGEVIVTKLRMMRGPDRVPGFMRVFPNYRHGGRADGYGCPRLSPMTLGPVEHGQPGVPAAATIEGFHQGNKVFASECDEKGQPSAAWFATQRKMYAASDPARHKPAADGGRASPLYARWVAKCGTAINLTYVESRQLYCTFYERLASEEEDLEALRASVDAGYNLQIVGYDGRPVVPAPGETVAQALDRMYLDASEPFGHELVLCCLLTLDPKDYPWRLHKTLDF